MRVSARFVAHCKSKPGPALKHEKQFGNFLVESVAGAPVYDNLERWATQLDQLQKWDPAMLKPIATAVVEMSQANLDDDVLPSASLPIKCQWFFTCPLFKDVFKKKVAHPVTAIKFDNMFDIKQADLKALLQMAWLRNRKPF